MKKRFLLPSLCGLFLLTSCSSLNVLPNTVTVTEKQVIVTISDEVEVIETRNKISDAYDKAKDSCVGLYITLEDGAASGSGVIYKYDEETKLYYVVTNEHVVDDATSVRIYDGDEIYYEANVIGTDAKNDIAVVTFSTEALGEERTFTPLDFMTSETTDCATVGQTALAIGCPLSLSTYNVLTTGVVSYVSNEQIFTDAALNPGNSGGGLFNIEGRLIGITNSKTVWTTQTENGVTSQIPVEGRGYAISLSLVKECITDIEAVEGDVTRPVLGMTVTNVNDLMGGTTYETWKDYLPEGTDQHSFIVAVEFTDGSIAEEAGIQVGDVIMKINGTSVHKNTDITDILHQMVKGDTIILSVYRKGTEGLTDIAITY